MSELSRLWCGPCRVYRGHTAPFVLDIQEREPVVMFTALIDENDPHNYATELLRTAERVLGAKCEWRPVS